MEQFADREKLKPKGFGIRVLYAACLCGLIQRCVEAFGLERRVGWEPTPSPCKQRAGGVKACQFAQKVECFVVLSRFTERIGMKSHVDLGLLFSAQAKDSLGTTAHFDK